VVVLRLPAGWRGVEVATRRPVPTPWLRGQVKALRVRRDPLLRAVRVYFRDGADEPARSLDGCERGARSWAADPPMGTYSSPERDESRWRLLAGRAGGFTIVHKR